MIDPHADAEFGLSSNAGLRAYLSLMDTTQLRQNMRTYELRAKRPRDREQIRNDINSVLNVSHSNSFTLPCFTRAFDAGQLYFRCRKLTEIGEFDSMSHAWEAPASYVSPGRLNVQHEPLIYTAVGDLATAAFEARIKDGDIFSMIVYRATERVTVACIEAIAESPGITGKESQKLDMILQFLQDAFTQKAGPEESHIYTAPEIIVKEFFDWPPPVAQGWGYPSIANPVGGYNVCFRPDQAREKLQVVEVLIATCTKITAEGIHFKRNRILRPTPEADGLDIVWPVD